MQMSALPCRSITVHHCAPKNRHARAHAVANIVTAYVLMVCTVAAVTVMANIVTAYIVLSLLQIYKVLGCLYNYGLQSYGLYSYGRYIMTPH